MDAKAIKRLADACRKAGIKHFKNSEVEFTLSDETPQVTRRRTKKTEVSQELEQTEIESESSGLSETDLLFWSSTINPQEN